jgi:hypothetical protein
MAVSPNGIPSARFHTLLVWCSLLLLWESSRLTEHSRTTKMLVSVIILFLLTELPQGVLIVCSATVKDFFDTVYLPLGDVMDIVALINNAVNFILYCTMRFLNVLSVVNYLHRIFLTLSCDVEFWNEYCKLITIQIWT